MPIESLLADLIREASQTGSMRLLSDRERFILEARAAGQPLLRVGRELSITLERVRQLERGAEYKLRRTSDIYPPLHEIGRLDLPPRTYKALVRASWQQPELTTIGGLFSKTPKELSTIRNVGPFGVQQILRIKNSFIDALSALKSLQEPG